MYLTSVSVTFLKRSMIYFGYRRIYFGPFQEPPHRRAPGLQPILANIYIRPLLCCLSFCSTVFLHCGLLHSNVFSLTLCCSMEMMSSSTVCYKCTNVNKKSNKSIITVHITCQSVKNRYAQYLACVHPYSNFRSFP